MLKKVIFIFSVVIFFSACKKVEHDNVHENKTIAGNQIPPITSISTIQTHAYINRVYVDLVGREADSTELATQTILLKNANFTDTARGAMIAHVINTKEFFTQLFIKTSATLLNSTSKQDIIDQINQDVYVRQLSLQTHDTITANAIAVELDALYKLQNVDSLFQIKQIDINEFYRRFIYNYFYDEINMGAENYVKACFENLFHRQPSVNELAQGEGMVNGLSSYVLFLQTGNSKGDFANIVSHSTTFYEGLITTAYLNYMLRKPTDNEINSLVTSLSQTKDYAGLIKSIMKSKEYAGF